MLHVLFAGLTNEQMMYDLSRPDFRIMSRRLPLIETGRTVGQIDLVYSLIIMLHSFVESMSFLMSIGSAFEANPCICPARTDPPSP